MTYKLFEEIVLTRDIPEKKLKKGDVATIVEHHSVLDGEDGYSLEVFDVLGNTIAVIKPSQIDGPDACPMSSKVWNRIPQKVEGVPSPCPLSPSTCLD